MGTKCSHLIRSVTGESVQDRKCVRNGLVCTRRPSPWRSRSRWTLEYVQCLAARPGSLWECNVLGQMRSCLAYTYRICLPGKHLQMLVFRGQRAKVDRIPDSSTAWGTEPCITPTRPNPGVCPPVIRQTTPRAVKNILSLHGARITFGRVTLSVPPETHSRWIASHDSIDANLTAKLMPRDKSL